MLDLQAAKVVICAEYKRLCNALRLHAVPLDIYQYDSAATGATPLGTPLAHGTAGYCGTRRVIVLPQCDGDWDCGYVLPGFPPTQWTKATWPAWRIELWHEVAHQVTSDLTRSLQPAENGRKRFDGTSSGKGHGEGWFQGVCRMASAFGVHPETLDTLLDR